MLTLYYNIYHCVTVAYNIQYSNTNSHDQDTWHHITSGTHQYGR